MRGRCARAAACLLAAVALPSLASAQGLRDRAFEWALGDYRAPLVCVLDGTAREALRRVRIQPGHGDRPSLRVTLYDLEAPAGITCSRVSGEPEPNVAGVVELVFEGRSRPDTGEVDFRNALRREGGFPFRVTTGHLRIGAAGTPLAELVPVDFAEGNAEIRSVPPGSDAARRLSGIGGERQRELRLSAPSGQTLVFELVERPRP